MHIWLTRRVDLNIPRYARHALGLVCSLAAVLKLLWSSLTRTVVRVSHGAPCVTAQLQHDRSYWRATRVELLEGKHGRALQFGGCIASSEEGCHWTSVLRAQSYGPWNLYRAIRTLMAKNIKQDHVASHIINVAFRYNSKKTPEKPGISTMSRSC